MFPRHGLKKFLAPEKITDVQNADDCFATGVTRQRLLTLSKMCNFNVDFSQIFWGLPDPHTGEGLPHPSRRSGASRLRASFRASLGTFGTSIVVSPL